MGVMRFAVHPTELVQRWPEIYRAYISGSNGRVFPTRIELDGNVITCRRQTAESGRLHIAWPIPGHGQPVLSTSWLPEREEPYLLAVELARGKLAQIREQAGKWEIAGLRMPDVFRDIDRAAHHVFARATAQQHDPAVASELAADALRKAFVAAELLAAAYAGQRLVVRRQRTSHLPVMLGCSLGPGALPREAAGAFCEAFNTALVPIEWRHIEPEEGTYRWEAFDAHVEWCLENRLTIWGGPLLDLSPEGMPKWLWQWEQDFCNLQCFVCDFVETAMARYAGRIRNWEIAARVNSGGALALNEELRLTLVARVLEVARAVDKETQLIVRVDQPWGDYQARGQHRLSPLQLVDAVVRAGVGLSGVNLEIGMGYRPRSCTRRDSLEVSRLIDLWGALGIPLHVTLAFPSADGADPNAQSDLEIDTGPWKLPWTEQSQADAIDTYLPILLAKEAVVGVYWTHMADATPHYYPHAGLLNAQGVPKPALTRLLHHRRAHWE